MGAGFQMKWFKQLACYLFTPILNRRIAAGRQNMLFIVGHMRSGSTLLVHLLASHSDVIGFGESHHTYVGPEDFGAVACRIYLSFRRLRWREKYILDKVLHAEFNVTPELVRFGNTRTVLLVRKPQAAIPSILNVPKLNWGEEQALRYYVERLALIRQFATELGPERCAFVTYEALINASREILDQLQKFLQLPPPALQTEYDTMWSTGRPYFGDTSQTIRAGHIVYNAQNVESRLSTVTLQRAEAAYGKYVDACRDHLGSGP